MVFALARTFHKPAATQGNRNRGFPEPGAGAQTSGDFTPAPAESQWSPVYPIQGDPTNVYPLAPANAARGYGDPLSPRQGRRGWGPGPAKSGRPVDVLAPWWSGHVADRTVHNFGKVLTNPIGAGVVARYRPQASYGPAGTYANGQIFWTSQAIPTTINLQGLTDPAALAAVLGPIRVQAVVRTTG